MPNFFDLPFFLRCILAIPVVIFVAIPASIYEVLKYIF